MDKTQSHLEDPTFAERLHPLKQLCFRIAPEPEETPLQSVCLILQALHFCYPTQFPSITEDELCLREWLNRIHKWLNREKETTEEAIEGTEERTVESEIMGCPIPAEVERKIKQRILEIFKKRNDTKDTE